MPTTQGLIAGIREACSTSCQEEDEAQPYKNKYQAADLLKKLLGERAICSEEPASNAESSKSQSASATDAPGQQGASSDSAEAVSSSTDSVPVSAQPSDEELAAAAARIRCGLILLETDLLSDGESSIKAGLPILEKAPEAYMAWLLEAYNALGALYSDRSDLPVALKWLKQAEELYRRITGTGTRSAHLTVLPIAGGAAAATATATATSPPDSSSSNGANGTNGTNGDSSKPAGQHLLQQQQQQQQNTQGQEQGQEQEQEQGQGQGQGQGSEGGQDSGSCEDCDASGPSGAVAEGPGGGGGGGGSSGGPAEAGIAASAAEMMGAPQGAHKAGCPAEVEAEAAPEGEQRVDPLSPSPLPSQLPDNDPDAVQLQYTKTLFYLAQVYGHMKAQDRSALYCAATLYRQLASGKYDLDTWVNNCLQLGGYYAKVHAYGLAMYCHAAAQAVVDRDTAAGLVLGEDIAANIQLATARVYNMRLAASHARHVEGKHLEMHYPDVSYFPDYLRFSGLAVPSPDTFPWGEAALAADFEGARELLNTGMPYFKAALSYYQLDGWVTDHVGIRLDMSNMYRCLAGFESDPSRAVAMHRCRCQLLEPLSGALNPDHYPGLSRSIDLELAHVYREISDVRDLQGGQTAKASAAAGSAARYYQRFLQSFASSETGALPDRVDTDNEPYFLMASFGLGRMLNRMKSGSGTSTASFGNGSTAQKSDGATKTDTTSYESLVIAAHKHLQWTSQYVRRHGLESWTQEAQAAEELSELLVEHMYMRARAAAARRAAG